MKNFITLVCLLFIGRAAHAQPVITSQPQSLTVNAGATARFTVSAADTNGLAFQWQLNGTNLSDGGAISGSTSATLLINPVALSDSAGYSVRVSAADGSVTSQPPAQLTVLQGTIVNFQISGFAAGPSNLVVELFDHDKPATVENFIHYITSGAYSNMFFDRLIPNFVIQGGDWSTSNQTSTVPGLALIDGGIYNFYVSENQVTNPPLPTQVDSEFSYGPLVPNTYGTLAMALKGTNQNSASSAFFINLADNSANLDFQDGGFTVFGRVMNASNLLLGGVSLAGAATNLLNYFNNPNFFSKPAQGIFDGSSSTNLSQFTDLPVNYDGTHQPANDNLFYVNFTFLSNSAAGLSGPVQPPVDTNPPTATIFYPTANLLLNNGSPLLVQGTASDNVGLALVNCSLVPLNGANNSQSFGGIATGTTTWSLDFVQEFGSIPTGAYEVQVMAQDGAGNLSATVLQPFAITAILTNGSGTVTLTNYFTGAVIANGVGAALEDGNAYLATATPAAGQAFLNWSGLGSPSINPTIGFYMSSSTLLTATFISNDLAGDVAFSSPPAGSQLTNNSFTISGTISGIASAQLTCQLFSQSTGNQVGQSVAVSGTTAWSVSATNLNLGPLQPGGYIIQVVAYDPLGRSTVISEAFTVVNPALLPVITAGPQSMTINAGSTATFSVSATNTDGAALTYQWQRNAVNLSDGGEIAGSSTAALTVSPAALSDAGAYSVVVSSADGWVSSQPAAQLTVLQGTIVNFKFSGFAGGPSNVVVELFDHDKPATVENFIHYITSGAYSNMFFERLLPGFILQGGDWSTVDRTNTLPPVNVLDNGIYDYFVLSRQVNNPPLPYQVDSEFSFGPFISNTYGTLAMALQPGNQNSAANGFFFNLADNSTNLDLQNGGFTVFARVLNSPNLSIAGTNLINAGTNLLNYFNNTNFFSPPASGLYTNNPAFPALPVNYFGTNQPTDTNLFYVDFTFLTNSALGLAGPASPPPVNTNLPTVSISYPSPGLVLTNGSPLVVHGTASDPVALAFVYCSLIPENGYNGGLPFGDFATGTTNWSLDFTVQEFGSLPPGQYVVLADDQNAAGNPNNGNYPVEVPITITAIVIKGNGIVTVTNFDTGSVSSIAVGYPFKTGQHYGTRAMPATGQTFVNWSGPNGVSISPSNYFVMANNALYTANFIPNNLAGALAITYPPAKGQITNNVFPISGTISNSAQITCRLFSQATGVALSPAVTISATNSWSLPVTNLASLAPGQYIVQAIAYDSLGRSTVATNAFTVMARLNVVVNGRGTISPTPNPFVVPGSYTLTAKPSAGQLFYTWSDGVNVSINPVETFTDTTGLTLTATFVSNDLPKGLAFTYPAANAKLTNGSFMAGGKAPALTTNITYQLFWQQTQLAVGPAVSLALARSSSAQNWTLPVTNLAPGAYTAVALAYDNQGRSTSISENFSLLAQLHVQIQGLGAESNLPSQSLGSVSPNYNGSFLVVGQKYSVTATPKTGQLFDNWSGGGISSNSAALTFTMPSNLTLTASFASNYFPSVKGTYYGLYLPSTNVYQTTIPNIAETNSGYFTLTLNSSGTYTGDLTFSGIPASLGGGTFRPDGTLELVNAQNTVLLALAVDLTNGTGTLTGSLTVETTSYIWTANLLAYRGVTALSSVTNFANGTGTAHFVLTVSGDPTEPNLPPGNGYETMSITTAGIITLAGMLADNTAILQTVGISKQGIWPLYVSLYGNKGVILGWQTNTAPTNFTGSLDWLKPSIGGAYYPNGFSGYNLNSSANSYSPPAPGSAYVISFGGGTLAEILTNSLTVNASRQFVPAAKPADKLSITLVTTTGALSGQFFNPATGKTVPFKGAFISPSLGGSGYTVDSDGQTGYFELQPAPASSP